MKVKTRTESVEGFEKDHFIQRFWWSLTIAALLTLAIGGGLLWQASHPVAPGGGFSGLSRSGAWHFSDDAKRLNLLYVGYVKCPDVCPMTLTFAGTAFRKLAPEELQKVRLIFLSVDHDHETPQAVADYASQFFPSFIGLSGSKAQIDQTVSLFGAGYVVESNPASYLGYSISHTDGIFFLNQKGKVVDTLVSPPSAEAISQKIRENL